MSFLAYRLTVGAALTLATVLLSAAPAYAAVPRIVLVYGPPLGRPVIMADWADNGWVVGGSELDPLAEDLDGRPYLEVAFFWGGQWDDYVRSGKPLDALQLEQASGYGRFYPAMGGAPAICACGGWWLRRLDPAGLDSLQRHGVPVRVDASAAGVPRSLPRGGDRPAPDVLALIGLGAGLATAGAMIRVAAGHGRANHGRDTARSRSTNETTPC